MKAFTQFAKIGVLVFLLAGLSAGGARSAAAAGAVDARTKQAIEEAMSRVYPALVLIEIVTADPSGGRMMKYRISGSGAIISKEGHIITNHHVAGKSTRIVCRMPDGEEIEAKLIGTDALVDIAVVQLDLEKRKDKTKPVPVAVFGDSDKVEVGEVVLAMGSPGGLTQSVTKGIVSNVNMMEPGDSDYSSRLDGEETGTLVRWIGHDAKIFGGNSGGPLVNLQGEIIGINEVAIAGLSGAIPGNLAISVANQLIETGRIKRSWTGLECQPRLKNSASEKGILISGIIEDSPAEKAGFKPGDILLEFDGVEVDARIHEDLPIFNRLALSTPIGKIVETKLSREGETKTLSLTTDAREDAQAKDVELKAWGLTVRDLTLMSALERKRPNKKGVLVSTLRSGGPSSEAKPPLNPSDIILQVDDEKIDNLADLRAVSEAKTKDQEDRVPVLVSFERKDLRLKTVVKIGKEPKPDEPIMSRKAWLSAMTQVLTLDLAKALGLEGKLGVRVTKVLPGRSAEKAGMKVGDVLLALNGDEIEASQPEDTQVLPMMIRQYKIDAEVVFAAMRDGEPLEIKVKLEEPPTPTSELVVYKDEYFELTVRELSFDDRQSQQLEEDTRGVIVDNLESAGWASLAHLRAGDILLTINGEKTHDVDTVEKALKSAREEKAKRVVFFVKRGIHTLFLEIEPSWDGKNG